MQAQNSILFNFRINKKNVIISFVLLPVLHRISSESVFIIYFLMHKMMQLAVSEGNGGGEVGGSKQVSQFFCFHYFFYQFVAREILS